MMSESNCCWYVVCLVLCCMRCSYTNRYEAQNCLRAVCLSSWINGKGSIMRADIFPMSKYRDRCVVWVIGLNAKLKLNLNAFVSTEATRKKQPRATNKNMATLTITGYLPSIRFFLLRYFRCTGTDELRVCVYIALHQYEDKIWLIYTTATRWFDCPSEFAAILGFNEIPFKSLEEDYFEISEVFYHNFSNGEYRFWRFSWYFSILRFVRTFQLFLAFSQFSTILVDFLRSPSKL